MAARDSPYAAAMNPVVEVRVLDPRLHAWGLPAYQTAAAAGIDLHACVDAPLSIHAQAPAVLIPAGIAVLMDTDAMAAVLLARSGLGHREGLIPGQCVGLIDADYTAGIMISAWNRNPPGAPPIIVQPGARIAQLVFVPILRPRFQVVDAFSRATARGGGGFGSTGG